MGACTVKTSVHRETEVKISIPKCFYFNRKDKILFNISNDNVTKYNFKGKVKAHHDSCIGVLDSGKIVVIGGSDSSGSLTNRVFLIDTARNVATEFTQIPKSAREGHLFEYKNYYYFVGGTVEADGVSADTSEEGSPIMRYNVTEHFWETFSHDDTLKHNVHKALNRKITDKEKHEHIKTKTEGMSLTHLIAPGAFLYEHRIYLVGGKIYNQGTHKITDKIFSFSLEDGRPDVREEELKLPVKLFNPMCTVGVSQAYITGGKLENGARNSDIFIVKIDEKKIEKCSFTFDSDLEESYPPIFASGEIIFFSFPKLWVKSKNQDKIYGFNFNRADAKEGNTATEVTLTTNLNKKPHVKTLIDLSVALRLDSEGDKKDKNIKIKEEVKIGEPKTGNIEKEQGKVGAAIDFKISSGKGDDKAFKAKQNNDVNLNDGKKGIKIEGKVSGNRNQDINIKDPVEINVDKGKGKIKVDNSPNAPKIILSGEVKSSDSLNASDQAKGQSKTNVRLPEGGARFDGRGKAGPGANTKFSELPSAENNEPRIEFKIDDNHLDVNNKQHKGQFDALVEAPLPKIGGIAKKSSSGSSSSGSDAKKVDTKGKPEIPNIGVSAEGRGKAVEIPSLNLGLSKNKAEIPKIGAKSDIKEQIVMPKENIEKKDNFPKAKIAGNISGSFDFSSSSDDIKGGIKIDKKAPKIEKNIEIKGKTDIKIEAPKEKINIEGKGVELPKDKGEVKANIPKAQIGGKVSNSFDSNSSSDDIKGGFNINKPAPKIEANLEMKGKPDAKIDISKEKINPELSKGKIDAPKMQLQLGGKAKKTESSDSDSDSDSNDGMMRRVQKIDSNPPKIETKSNPNFLSHNQIDAKAKLNININQPKAKIEGKIKGESSNPDSGSSKEDKKGEFKIDSKLPKIGKKGYGSPNKVSTPRVEVKFDNKKGGFGADMIPPVKKIEGNAPIPKTDQKNEKAKIPSLKLDANVEGQKISLPKGEAKIEGSKIPFPKGEAKVEAPVNEKAKFNVKARIHDSDSSDSSSSSSMDKRNKAKIDANIKAPSDKIEGKMPSQKFDASSKIPVPSADAGIKTDASKSKIDVKVDNPKAKIDAKAEINAKISVPKTNIKNLSSPSDSSSDSDDNAKVQPKIEAKIPLSKTDVLKGNTESKAEVKVDPKGKIPLSKSNLGIKAKGSSSSSSEKNIPILVVDAKSYPPVIEGVVEGAAGGKYSGKIDPKLNANVKPTLSNSKINAQNKEDLDFSSDSSGSSNSYSSSSSSSPGNKKDAGKISVGLPSIKANEKVGLNIGAGIKSGADSNIKGGVKSGIDIKAGGGSNIKAGVENKAGASPNIKTGISPGAGIKASNSSNIKAGADVGVDIGGKPSAKLGGKSDAGFNIGGGAKVGGGIGLGFGAKAGIGANKNKLNPSSSSGSESDSSST